MSLEWLWSWQALMAAAGGAVVFVAGWFSQRILDKVWDAYWRNRKDKARTLEGSAIADPVPTAIKLSSSFANMEHEFETVLRLRRMYFGAKVIVPDDVYRSCWLRNPDTLKLVSYLGQPIGYWGAIPVEHEAYERFIQGNSSHAEMLAKQCLAWKDVTPDAAYFYIVGAVVPLREGGDLQSLFQKLLSWWVVLDMCRFGLDVFKYFKVKGICGYPSRSGGYRLLERMAGFEKTKVLVDADDQQPIFRLAEEGTPQLRSYFHALWTAHKQEAPKWEVADRRRIIHRWRKLSQKADALPPAPGALDDD